MKSHSVRIMDKLRKLGLTEITRPSINEIKNYKRFPIYTVLDNIRSMYNVGSVFRSSDAARIEKLIICGMTASPPRKEIDKTALGAVESVPWEYYQNTKDAVKTLKNKGISIIAVEHTTTSTNYKNLYPDFPIALIFGNEVVGIQDDIIALADHTVEIPMFGIKHSLNVAVSYGIIVYDFLFKYLSKNNNLI